MHPSARTTTVSTARKGSVISWPYASTFTVISLLKMCSQVAETSGDVHSTITDRVSGAIMFDSVNLNRQYESSEGMKVFFRSGVKPEFGDDPI